MKKKNKGFTSSSMNLTSLRCGAKVGLWAGKRISVKSDQSKLTANTVVGAKPHLNLIPPVGDVHGCAPKPRNCSVS